MAEVQRRLPQDDPEHVPVNALTTDDVLREGGKIGKDVLRTSAVWTLSGLLTQSIRALLKKAGVK